MAKWATKNPPKKRGRYLITVKGINSKPYVIMANREEYPKGNWGWYGLPTGTFSEDVVTAWQKCPEPYKGE